MAYIYALICRCKATTKQNVGTFVHVPVIHYCIHSKFLPAIAIFNPYHSPILKYYIMQRVNRPWDDERKAEGIHVRTRGGHSHRRRT